MSGNDLMTMLKQQKFPECVRVAVEQLATVHLRREVTAPNSDELEQQIVAEFILFKNTKKKLNAIQELQVIEILLKFFSTQSNETVRHAVFKSLFARSVDNECQMSLLSKFISMAVGVKNSNVLNSAAVWMQSQGCSSASVVRICTDVIGDYILFSSDLTLKHLPQTSAHFTCSLLTAATCIYSLPGSKSPVPVLPRQLLELICDWLTVEPQLCLVSLFQVHTQSQRAALWTSPTKSNTLTPVPGLVRWATKALMVCGASRPVVDDSLSELWSRLHLVILQTLVSFPSLPGARQLELLTLADMNQTVRDVVALVKTIPDGLGDRDVELSINRLVQVLQVALATGAFRCSLSDLRGICQRIPPCRLLQIVQSQHLSAAPPLMHNAS